MLASEAQTTQLRRSSTLQQFNFASVLGVKVANYTLPIIYELKLSSTVKKRGVIYYDNSMMHKCFLYSEILHEETCRRAVSYLTDYYRVCELEGTMGTDGNITHPYTLQKIRQLNVQPKYSNASLNFLTKRKWYNGTTVFRSTRQARQECKHKNTETGEVSTATVSCGCGAK